MHIPELLPSPYPSRVVALPPSTHPVISDWLGALGWSDLELLARCTLERVGAGHEAAHTRLRSLHGGQLFLRTPLRFGRVWADSWNLFGSFADPAWLFPHPPPLQGPCQGHRDGGLPGFPLRISTKAYPPTDTRSRRISLMKQGVP